MRQPRLGWQRWLSLAALVAIASSGLISGSAAAADLHAGVTKLFDFGAEKVSPRGRSTMP